MHKPDIKKIIGSQPEFKVNHLNKKTTQPQAFVDSPLFAMAQGFLQTMPAKYKAAIGLAIYLLLSGVVGTGYGIYKLIILIIESI